MSDGGFIAEKRPYVVEAEAGKTYFWCSCGRSENQPLCDGAHTGTDMSPKAFKAERTEAVYLCGCKRTKNPPFCDGTHSAA